MGIADAGHMRVLRTGALWVLIGMGVLGIGCDNKRAISPVPPANRETEPCASGGTGTRAKADEGKQGYAVDDIPNEKPTTAATATAPATPGRTGVAMAPMGGGAANMPAPPPVAPGDPFFGGRL